MQFKQQSATTIEYLLIGNGSPIIAPFLPPEDIKSEILNFLRHCPIDLIQLYDSLEFYTLYLKNNLSIGYNFHVLNAKDYSWLKEDINSKKQIQVFFLDGKKKSHLKIYQSLKTKNSYRFFYFYNKKPDLHDTRIINRPSDLIKAVILEHKTILKYLGINHKEIAPSVLSEFKDLNQCNFFTPTMNNYFLIEKIIGNLGIKLVTNEKEGIKEKSGEAMKSPNSFTRQNHFCKQINIIDNFNNYHYHEELIKPVNGSEPMLAPLIYISPFHNPDLKKIFHNHEVINFLLMEQSENYTQTFNIDKEEGDNPLLDKQIITALQLQAKRVNYLDHIGMLHSSFSYSPVVRLPIKGKSIYRELSFFKTGFFMNLSRVGTRRTLKKTIYKFGNKLKESTLSDKLKDIIKNRNGQIVAISDLPIEWLLIDNIPLSFTHDVCKLPETTMHGLMAFYTINQKFVYSIPKDIMSKTLVILGAHEPAFKKWHPLIFDLSKKYGFNIAPCHTLEEVKQIIHKLRPEFLIFDTHGGYDEKTNSTYLLIGNEKLDGHYVIKNNITAPLIFLSACGTAPTYGTINPIANAFIESGSFTVTSTYTPISVDTGSLLYYRILFKLASATLKGIHKNWLEFICHAARTSAINDAYTLAHANNNNTDPNEIINTHAESLVDSMFFSKRRKLYHELDQKLSQLTKSERLHFSLVIPEYLLYTHLGRADLILFDSWKKAHNDKNGIQE